MKTTKLQIDQFINLNNNETKRKTEIMDQMDLVRDFFPNDEEGWIKACMNKIPKTDYELMYVIYIMGFMAKGRKNPKIQSATIN